MKLNSKIALSMLILLGLGCAKKKSNSNNDAPKTSTESSAASAPLPNPEPKTMPEVVENAKAAAAEVSEAAEAVIEEVKKAPEAPGKNSTKDDDITKLTELKNATDAVKNEDPKKLDETLSNPKLDDLRDELDWDQLMSQSFEKLGQDIKNTFDKFGQDTKKAFDDAGQEIKNTFENDVKPALQTADKEAHDALNQSVGDLPVPGVGNVPVSIGMLAGGSIIVVSAIATTSGLASYFKNRDLLTKEQKLALQDVRSVYDDIHMYATLKKNGYTYLNDSGFSVFRKSTGKTDYKYNKFLKKFSINDPEHTTEKDVTDKMTEKNRAVTQKLKDLRSQIKYSDSNLWDEKGFFRSSKEYLASLEQKVRTKITNDNNALKDKEIDKLVKEELKKRKNFYDSYVKENNIRPNEHRDLHKNKLKNIKQPLLRQISTLNKLGIGGGLAGMLAGGGLMAYTQLGGNMFGLAESEARTRLKKALEALSEVESQLWEVREAQGIGE